LQHERGRRIEPELWRRLSQHRFYGVDDRNARLLAYICSVVRTFLASAQIGATGSAVQNRRDNERQTFLRLLSNQHAVIERCIGEVKQSYAQNQ